MVRGYSPSNFSVAARALSPSENVDTTPDVPTLSTRLATDGRTLSRRSRSRENALEVFNFDRGIIDEPV
jgi:hypothetical protein